LALVKHETMDKPQRGQVDSYADDLREAFAGSRDDDADDASNPLQPRTAELKPDPEPDPEVDTSPPDGSQESKYGDPETEPSVVPEVEGRKAKADAEAETARRADQKVAAPEFWNAEDKEKFAALPDDSVRQTVLDWRKQIEKGAQEKFDAAAEARKVSEKIDQLVAPYAQELQQRGMSKLAVVERMFAVEGLLRQNPEQGLQWLLDQYGQGQFAMVRKGAQAQAGETPRPNGAPNGAGQQITPDMIAQAVDQRLQAYQEVERRQQYAVALETSKKSIEEFAEAKGENEQPLHPHFEAVKMQMGSLMQLGAAVTLEDAYNQAIWTQPALREQLTKAQQEAAASASAEAQRQAIAKAKAARTPRTASVHQAPADEDEGLPQQELLRKVWRQQQSGGSRA
jgi:hypothetical protein